MNTLALLPGLLTLIALIALIAGLVFLFAWIRLIPTLRREMRFAQFAATRERLSDIDFCRRGNLPHGDCSRVHTIRKALGHYLKINPESVYPDDEIDAYGFAWDDEVSGFIHDCGLIPKDPFWFPLDKGSCVRDMLPWIDQINAMNTDKSSGL
jgi:hypothetical protein